MNCKRIYLLIIMFVPMFAAGQHMFDYEDIKNKKFTTKTISGVRSMNDGEHYTIMSDDNRIEKYAYKTGEKEATVFEAGGFPELEGEFSGYAFSPNEKKILITTNKQPIYRHSFIADNWVYDIASGGLEKLTKEGAEQEATFSPDGNRVVFVRKNDLWQRDLNQQDESRITTDGSHNNIINGHTDWVYEEEFAFTRAFEFSPDGKKLAFLRFDQSDVPEFTIQRYVGLPNPDPLTFKYPRAGQKNSDIELWVYSFEDSERVRIDLGPDTDQYIARLGWTPAGELFYYRINRLQSHFEVLLADSKGDSHVIYSEKDSRYVDRPDEHTITFLPKGGRFVVKNETSGYCHLYLYSTTRGVVDTLTRGSWDVTQLLDVVDDRAYYISKEGSPLRNNLYSVRLNGKGKTRLTTQDGTYSITPGCGFKYFISYFSNVATPRQVCLHNSQGKVVRVLEDNAAVKQAVEQRRVPRKEFFKFTTGRGTVLNGYMIKPYDFNPDKKYPVLMTQYNGPGSQQVLDSWTLGWTDVLVQEGYIVVCVDGRGTGGRGAEFKKITYGKLGALETEDQIAAAKYIATQSYVDMGRVGIYGWSYGGFMALNCILKGADVFKMAIAVAPVTSWRYYDSVYTEIYNGMPQDNPYGYDNNSPVNFAAELKGKLLMIHGSGDDNVHLVNTYAMADALVKANKKFDMMIYPDDNHSMKPAGMHHIMETMIDYTLKNL